MLSPRLATAHKLMLRFAGSALFCFCFVLDACVVKVDVLMAACGSLAWLGVHSGLSPLELGLV